MDVRYPQRPLVGAASVALLALGAACNGGGGGGSGPGDCDHLLPGDVVISEIMANPIGQSGGKEWFEIYNPGDDTIDLEGAVLVNETGGDRHVMGSLEVPPREYAVLGNVLPDFMEPWHDYAYGEELGSLRNSGGELAIECGEDVVDHVVYPAMDAGVSMGFDGALEPDPTLNDDPNNWCPAEQEFDDDGSLGTPGERNDACGAVVQENCREGGDEREVIEPEEGGLVISEIMANTTSEVNFREGEWFEIYVAQEGGVDLNGLQLGRYIHEDEPDSEVETGPREIGHTLGSADCLHHEEGSYIVFARSGDPDLNGGLPHVDYVFELDRGTGLRGSYGGIYLAFDASGVPEPDEFLDVVTWADPWPSADRQNHDGASLSLDPNHLDPEDNNDPGNWCFSLDRFSEHGAGTPGEANAACFGGGPCVDPDTGDARASEPPSEGDLVITEVMANNQDGVVHSDGGWFEVLVREDVDLNALQLGEYDEEEDEPEEIEMALTFRECLRYDAGSHVLFAMADDDGHYDPILDVDEIEVDFEFNFGWPQLSQSGDGIFLTLDNDLNDLLEHVTWDSATSGVALSLDPEHADPEGSADPDNWCDADEADENLDPYFCCGPDEDVACPEPDDGDGEGCSFGTPGEENPSCPGDDS